MRADRLLELITLLRRKERTTAAELAAQLGVSRRTVLRDLDALSLSGVPVYAEHGRNGGFAMLPGYRPETAGLTEDEAQALFLPGGEVAAEAIGRGPEFRSARTKLEAVLSDDATRGIGDLNSWLLVVPEGWGRPEPPPDVVPTLAEAARRRQVIRMDYRAMGQPARTREVCPLGLVLAGRTWYLVAEREASRERRTYRVDRIQHLTITEGSFESETSLTDAWEQARARFRGGRAGLSVTLAVREDSLSVVTFLLGIAGRVVSVEDEGTHLQVHAEVEHLHVAAALLTGVGERAKILGPPELIDEVLALSRTNLERYS